MRQRPIPGLRPLAVALGVLLAAGAAGVATADAPERIITGSTAPADAEADTYSAQEIIDKGHRFFGKTTGGLAEAVEWVFKKKGRPNAYIIGEEGAGAFFGGLRYGEGWLHPKSGGRYKVYWQGPSFGIDMGGNGSRVLALVYNLHSPRDIFRRFPGGEGVAYVVGGFGVNIQNIDDRMYIAPIRTGVGLRLGINVGYLKYTARPTWNPF